MKRILIILGALVLCANSTLHADAAAEAKMREQLRAVMMQLRTAEAERANLQATQAEKDAKIKELTDQAAAMAKQMGEDKTVADKAIAELRTRLEQRDADIVGLKQNVEKLTGDLKKMTEIANTKEAQRTKLTNDVILLQRQVADQQLKNAEMYKLAVEILDPYEKFSLGEAIVAREPFTGITRVKLQTFFQDYGDKVTDAKIKPAPPADSDPGPKPKIKNAPKEKSSRE